MADRGDTHYHVGTLNKWFLGSSLVLAATIVWMVIADWDRPWKDHQRQFRTIELARAAAALESDELEAAQAAEDGLLVELAAAQRDVDANQEALERARGELLQLDAARFNAVEAAKSAKANYMWDRYSVEEERLHAGDPQAGEELVAGSEALYFATQRAKEVAEADYDAKQDEIAGLTAAVSDVEKRIKAATRELDLVRKKQQKLAPTDAATRVAEIVRDAPGLDFIGPNLKVQKVVLKNLTFELNFTKKQRIDMCMSCHLGIEKEGYDDLEQPYSAHPRLDLYLSAKSHHPTKDFGCTICHRGAGEALDFVRADHRPSDEAEQQRWIDERHWHKQHHWDYPMLSTGYVEASCVQCHKSSMELIADAAPRVTEGYRLAERYGCYACHKIDWFPTKRRPGPSLKNLQAKLTPEFVAAWVADPKAFRPTTRMPQIFHLENFADAEPVVEHSAYGAGPAVMGREWNDTAVAAVTSFLVQRNPRQPLPPAPAGGDAARGREVFRVAGCLACHNIAPLGLPAAGAAAGEGEGSGAAPDLAEEPRGENEHGPNLRGVATKVNRDWLYAWVRDPAAYWPETRMPDLRLSDADALDLVAYLTEDPDGWATDVPEGWTTGVPAYDRAALAEQARWFFRKDGQEAVTARLEGRDPAHPWADDQVLLAAVGEKLVTHQGCFSCHEISGMESMMPIGVELTNWGSKTVDKLDFGFMAHIKGEQLNWDHFDEHQFLSYREGWIEQKLNAPRSYDQRKIKDPIEKLRMPYFGLTADEVQAIATFVVGLVDDEVQAAKMVPDAASVARDAGLRAIRQYNCAACHVLEPGAVTFEQDGRSHTLAAELLPLEGRISPPPMGSTAEWQASLADYLAEMRADDEEFELAEVGLQLLAPAPGFGRVGDRVFVAPDAIEAVHPPWGGDFVRLVTDYYLNWSYDQRTADPDGEGKIEDVDGAWRQYSEEPYDKVRWTFAPPVLVGEGDKLQRDWFYSFLEDVVPLRPQIRVRMPSFHFAPGEAGAIADYFAAQAAVDRPARFVQALMQSRDLDASALAAAAAEAGVVVPASAIEAIVLGRKVETLASFPKLEQWAGAQGFAFASSPSLAHEQTERRTTAHLAARTSADPDYLAKALALAASGPNCFSCHFLNGAAPTNDAPIAWAPDLALTRERLREEWTQIWLSDPGRVYPGTSMPANFSGPAWSQWPGLSTEEQREAVLDWLYNADRPGLGARP
jgi:cytochrome c2